LGRGLQCHISKPAGTHTFRGVTHFHHTSVRTANNKLIEVLNDSIYSCGFAGSYEVCMHFSSSFNFSLIIILDSLTFDRDSKLWIN
jgi:hypothetical protein